MESHTHKYVVSIVGLIYGTIGYGLSILTCVFGAALRHFLPATPRPPKISRGRRSIRLTAQGPSIRRSRSSFKRSPSNPLAPNNLKANSSPLVNPCAHLRRTSSMKSLIGRQLDAPVITINHVDRVDNLSIKAPTITIHPNPRKIYEDAESQSALSHPPSFSIPPRRRPSPPADASRIATAFHLNLKPNWGSEKPKIQRSASSPQLTGFVERKQDPKGAYQEKGQQDLPAKGNKKPSKQEKRLGSAGSSSSKFFSPFPKNVEKKRSQTLRTHPYDAPYFLPPPVPPIPPDEFICDKEAKRSETLLSGKVQGRNRPSTTGQGISIFKVEKANVER